MRSAAAASSGALTLKNGSIGVLAHSARATPWRAVKLRRANDGTIEAVKHAQEGAGIITSLTETDGLVELTEDTTVIEPGATVGFLSYAALAG